MRGHHITSTLSVKKLINHSSIGSHIKINQLFILNLVVSGQVLRDDKRCLSSSVYIICYWNTRDLRSNQSWGKHLDNTSFNVK